MDLGVQGLSLKKKVTINENDVDTIESMEVPMVTGNVNMDTISPEFEKQETVIKLNKNVNDVGFHITPPGIETINLKEVET